MINELRMTNETDKCDLQERLIEPISTLDPVIDETNESISIFVKSAETATNSMRNTS